MHVRDARRVTNRFAIYAASRLPDTFFRGARSAVPCRRRPRRDSPDCVSRQTEGVHQGSQDDEAPADALEAPGPGRHVRRGCGGLGARHGTGACRCRRRRPRRPHRRHVRLVDAGDDRRYRGHRDDRGRQNRRRRGLPQLRDARHRRAAARQGRQRRDLGGQGPGRPDPRKGRGGQHTRRGPRDRRDNHLCRGPLRNQGLRGPGRRQPRRLRHPGELPCP